MVCTKNQCNNSQIVSVLKSKNNIFMGIVYNKTSFSMTNISYKNTFIILNNTHQSLKYIKYSCSHIMYCFIAVTKILKERKIFDISRWKLFSIHLGLSVFFVFFLFDTFIYIYRAARKTIKMHSFQFILMNLKNIIRV